MFSAKISVHDMIYVKIVESCDMIYVKIVESCDMIYVKIVESCGNLAEECVHVFYLTFSTEDKIL